MASFSATVSDWVTAEKARQTAVFRASVQEFVSQAQVTVPAGGNMPISTGFLRASILISREGPPISRADGQPEAGKAYPENGQVALVIAGAEIGETIYGAWSAAYAKRMEYGFVGTDSLGRQYNQVGFGFVAKAAQKWPEIVAEQSATAQSYVHGSGK